jgi:hypothetical protein
MRLLQTQRPFVAPTPLTGTQRAEYLETEKHQSSPQWLQGRRPSSVPLSPRNARYTDVSLQISSCCVGYVIGSKGSTVRRIAKITRTSIHIDQKRGLDWFPVQIYGSQKGIVLAKQKIDAIVGKYPEEHFK